MFTMNLGLDHYKVRLTAAAIEALDWIRPCWAALRLQPSRSVEALSQKPLALHRQKPCLVQGPNHDALDGQSLH